MENLIHLQILTEKEVLTDEMVHYVDVPMSNGRYGILKNHAPMLGVVTRGSVRYDVGGQSFFTEVDEGLLSVKANQVEILTRETAAPQNSKTAT